MKDSCDLGTRYKGSTAAGQEPLWAGICCNQFIWGYIQGFEKVRLGHGASLTVIRCLSLWVRSSMKSS